MGVLASPCNTPYPVNPSSSTWPPPRFRPSRSASGSVCRKGSLPPLASNLNPKLFQPAPLPSSVPQIRPEEEREWKRVQRSLADEFTFSELGGEARQVFNMFIQ